MSSTVISHTGTTTTVGSAKPHFRSDIQGLRAIAVLLVLLYHGGLRWLPGGYVGVDVFFVISGFLITGLLIRELTATGTISLVDFYARRARRILPAALLVILLTLVAGVLWLPRSRLESLGWDAVGAALSVVNWQFAAGATDYLQQDDAPSSLQHYWSLAVEEQFYLIWPALLLVAGAAGLAASRRRSSRAHARRPPALALVCRRTLAASLVVGVLSFVHSGQFSASNAGAAYFITTTRIWEMLVGAAVAAALPLAPPLGAWLRGVLGWAGLAAVVAAALLFNEATVFPGHAAALPVLGAAAVIAAGSPGSDASWSAAAFLSVRPMRFIGDISFSLYLVHWPVLTIVAGSLFADDMPARYGVPLALATILPAWLCYRFVERPFMRWSRVARRRDALLVGLAGMLSIALVATVVAVVPGMAGGPGPGSGPAGAAVLAHDPRAGVPVDTVASISPSTADAEEDLAAVYEQDCIVQPAFTDPKHCTFGAEGSDTSIALIGDSHAAHWLPAVQKAAEERGWQVHTFIKSSCGISAALTARPVKNVITEYPECLRWNELVAEEVVALAPDLVVVSNAKFSSAGDVPVAEGMAEAWRWYTDAGLDVAVLNDTPRPAFDVPGCVDRNRDSLTRCAYDRDEALALSAARDLERATELHGDVRLFDFNDLVCPEERCAVVIGGALVFYDRQHMTATYSATMAGPVGDALASALPAR